MDVWKELENRNLYPEILKESTAAASMIKTDLSTIWKTAKFILHTAADITEINNPIPFPLMMEREFSYFPQLLVQFLLLRPAPEIHRLIILQFCQKASFLQFFLNHIQNLLTLCQHGMIMIAGCHIHEQT